jgi:hypothetical protein
MMKQLTTWSKVLQAVTVFRLVNKFLAFYGTRRFTYCRIHNSQPLDPVLRQMGQVCILTEYTFNVHFNIVECRPLLGNDIEIGHYTTVVTKQLSVNCNEEMVFSVRSVLICYKKDKLGVEVS